MLPVSASGTCISVATWSAGVAETISAECPRKCSALFAAQCSGLCGACRRGAAAAGHGVEVKARDQQASVRLLSRHVL